MRTVNTHSVTKHVASILAKYNRIYAFVLSAAVIIGLSRRSRRPRQLARTWRRHCCRHDRSSPSSWHFIACADNFGTHRPGRSRSRPKTGPQSLVEGLEQWTIAELEALIAVSDDRDRTALAWLRDSPEAPTQKNLVGVVERLQFVRSLGVGPDREQRIHRARYRAIAQGNGYSQRPASFAIRYAAPTGDSGRVRPRDGSDPNGRGTRHVRQDAWRRVPPCRARLQRKCCPSSESSRCVGACAAQYGESHVGGEEIWRGSSLGRRTFARLGTIKSACCGNRNCRHKHAQRQSPRNRRKIPDGTPDNSRSC